MHVPEQPGRDAWRSSGAPEAGSSGRFVHKWQEHRDPDKTWRTGKWRKAEDDLVQQAYEDYCSGHNLTGDDMFRPILEGVKGTDWQDLWLDVASRFKHRTVRAVMRRAVRLLHPGNHRGKWLDSEKEVLWDLVQQHGKSWKAIGAELGRLPATVASTYERMAAAPGAVKGLWSAEELSRLRAAVTKCGRLLPSGDIVSISWPAVAAAVTTRNASQCMAKWNTMAGVIMGKKWSTREDRELLAAVMGEDDATDISDVNFTGAVGGRTAREARIRFEQLCKRVPGFGATGVRVLQGKLSVAGSSGSVPVSLEEVCLELDDWLPEAGEDTDEEEEEEEAGENEDKGDSDDNDEGGAKRTKRNGGKGIAARGGAGASDHDDSDSEEVDEAAAAAARKAAKKARKAAKKQAKAAAAAAAAAADNEDEDEDGSAAGAAAPAEAEGASEEERAHKQKKHKKHKKDKKEKKHKKHRSDSSDDE